MDPVKAAEEIAAGRLDAVAIARQNLVDHEWVHKILSGHEDEIKPCIRCHNGCFNMSKFKGTANLQSMDDSLHLARCALNPTTMQHNKYKIVPTRHPKKVAIIGGGIGGMECALVLKQRGHTPVIFEKTGELGGLFLTASAMSFKENDKELIRWYLNEVAKEGIDVRLNTEVTDVNTLRGFDEIIVATGSVNFAPPIPGLKENPNCIDSTGALSLEALPKSMVVIGGGVIGVEIATIFAALGSRVTLLEQANRLLESMDPMISEQMEANLRSKGIEVHCNVQVMEIKDRGNDTVSVNYRCERGWKESPADRVLVAVGRRPNMSKVLADDCQVQLENGRPLIKGTYRTTQENVYAIGDTVARKRLAHVAASHAAYLVENLAGRGHRMQLSVVPNGMYVVLPVVPTCIYTEPEIAAVGFTENDARLYNMKIKCGVAYMTENGKALLARNSRGFVRLIFEAYTNTLIGAQIMCARATDMIGEMATAIANGLTAYQLSTAMRAHPTYSEAITEAIEDALKNG